jgi:hypothetical protein
VFNFEEPGPAQYQIWQKKPTSDEIASDVNFPNEYFVQTNSKIKVKEWPVNSNKHILQLINAHV